MFFVVMHDTFGKEFHEKLAAQKPVFSRDLANSERRVARGEYPLYLPVLAAEQQQPQGPADQADRAGRGRPYVRFDLDHAEERAASQRGARCS